MKTAIYIPGLGGNDNNIDVYKYCKMLVTELDLNNPNQKLQYEIVKSKISYQVDDSACEAQIAIIKEISPTGSKDVYRVCEYDYKNTLTSKYKSKSIFIQLYLLSTVVFKKLIFAIYLLFKPRKSFLIKRRYAGQILLGILFGVVISVFGFFLLFSAFDVLLNIQSEAFETNTDVGRILAYLPDFGSLTEKFVSLSALLILLKPNLRQSLDGFATELICANYYFEVGERKHIVLGRLDKLIEKLAEDDYPDDELHIHAYSFGTIIAFDFLFSENEPSRRIKTYVTSLVTIGSPFDFIKTYYNDYFKGRENKLEKLENWLNVYAENDLLGSDFRKPKTRRSGESTYSISEKVDLKPQNLKYEFTGSNKKGFLNFISLYSLKVHSMYWDSEESGQSCMRLIVNEMLGKKML